jgi:amidase
MRDRVWSVDDADLGPEAVLAYAGLATFPGLPSTVLPVGGAGHLPVGMQVIGDRFRDHDTIAAATAIGALFA